MKIVEIKEWKNELLKKRGKKREKRKWNKIKNMNIQLIANRG